MGVAALGTVVGSILAGRVPLKRALAVLPVGVIMGFAVMLMPIVHESWAVYGVLLLIGGLSGFRSEAHTSELQSLMLISYAVFFLKKKMLVDNRQRTPLNPCHYRHDLIT